MKLTPEEKQIVRAFCDFIYEVPVGSIFTLSNLQGALRFVNPGIPARQRYSQYLRIATEDRWIEPLADSPHETYRRRIRAANETCQRSAYMRGELQILKDKIIRTLDGVVWLD
jgi:hypothetical protein